jgi:hypothetical protein
MVKVLFVAMGCIILIGLMAAKVGVFGAFSEKTSLIIP